MQPSRATQVAALNARYRHHGATDVVAAALSGDLGRVAMVSSFGAESVVLLHMLAVTRPDTPVLFLNTGFLFTETLVYQQELAERLHLRDIRILSPDAIEAARADAQGILHQSQPDACCDLRKRAPLQKALAGFDSWITGRKRFQAVTRQALQHFEVERGTRRIKVNPLAFWAAADVQTYMDENRLPRHPLVVRGYPSIGCAPCTQPVAEGDDPRSGRWAGQEKTECGLHMVNGRLIPNKTPNRPKTTGETV